MTKKTTNCVFLRGRCSNCFNFSNRSIFHLKGELMKPIDNHANQLNPNKGTSGVNAQYKARMDNRANQLNPNNRRFQGGKKK